MLSSNPVLKHQAFRYKIENKEKIWASDVIAVLSSSINFDVYLCKNMNI